MLCRPGPEGATADYGFRALGEHIKIGLRSGGWEISGDDVQLWLEQQGENSKLNKQIEDHKRLREAERDAARYRWLRATTNYVTSNGKRIDVRNMPEKWDAAIDAAIAAQGGSDAK